MIEYMLSEIITSEFEKVVGKNQRESRKSFHVGFRMKTSNSTDQYRIAHLYVFAPANYVHVVVQEETIDARGHRNVEPMRHLCYHDSCWRDSIQSFIFENRAELGGFQSLLKLFDWYDVLVLGEDEIEYLHLMDKARSIAEFGTGAAWKQIEEKLKTNPFDKRSVWNKTK
jgi:hypothetical protein